MCISDFFFQAEYGNLLDNMFSLDRSRSDCSGDKHFSSAVNDYNAGWGGA